MARPQSQDGGELPIGLEALPLKQLRTPREPILALALDFDLTLTTGKTSRVALIPDNPNAVSAAQLVAHIDAFMARPDIDDALAQLMRTPLHASNRAVFDRLHARGTRLYIVTFGYKLLVDRILRRLGLRDYFSDIVTPADFKDEHGKAMLENSGALGTKNPMLELVHAQLMASSPLVPVRRSSIVLVDDDYRNVVAAVEPGFQILYSQSDYGEPLNVPRYELLRGDAANSDAFSAVYLAERLWTASFSGVPLGIEDAALADVLEHAAAPGDAVSSKTHVETLYERVAAPHLSDGSGYGGSSGGQSAAGGGDSLRNSGGGDAGSHPLLRDDIGLRSRLDHSDSWNAASDDDGGDGNRTDYVEFSENDDDNDDTGAMLATN